MTSPSRSRSWIWVIVWTLVALCQIASALYLIAKLWFLPALAIAVWWALGLAMLLVMLFRRRWRSAGALAVCGAVLSLAWAPIADDGDHVIALVRLQFGGYRQVVAEAANLPDRGEAHGLTYIVDRGTPPRVAFVDGGLLDNWSGLVYDPTDRVAEARGWGSDSTFTAPPEIKSLFGGDIVWCDRITGHWYRCSFT